MGPYLFGNAILIGFFGCAALQGFRLWWHSRREHIFLVLAAHCAMLAIFSGSLVAIATATTVSACQLAFDVRTTFGLLLQVSNFWLLMLLLGLRGHSLVFLIALACACLIAINFAVGPITGRVVGVGRFLLPWGEEIAKPIRSSAPWWVWPGYILVASVQLFGLFAATRLWLRDRVGGILLALASGALLVTAVTGATTDIFRENLPYFGVYAHAAWVVLIALALSREYHRRGDELAASDRRFRAIFDQSFPYLGLMSTDGRLLEANRSALEGSGIRESDVIGKRFWETPWWTHSPELQQKLRLATEAAARGETVRFETTHRRVNGQLHYFDFSLKPVRNERGEVVLLIPEGHDITERKRVEEALGLSEARYRTLIESAPEAIVVLDAESGVFADFNEKACELFGVSAEALRALGPVELSPPRQPDGRESREVAAEYVRQSVAGASPVFDWMHRTPAGKEVPCEVRLVRLPFRERILIRGSVTDISERKRAEEALKQSEERYRLIVENQTEFVVKWLPDGTRTFANESYCRHFGISESECIGTSFFPVVSAETRGAFMQMIASLTPETPQATGEQLCTVAGGELRWQEWTRRGTFDARGKLVEVLSTGRDITERKRVEEELRQSEERFRGAFEFAAIGMGLVAPDGRWLRVNQSLCDIVGYTERELLALDFQTITHPDDLHADLDYLRQMLEGSIAYYHLEKRYIHKQGGTVWILLSVSLLRDRKGEPLYFISQVQNISERKSAQETLQAYTNRLKALSHQILETQETERRRLARELHDEIGQMLTTIGLRLYQLKAGCPEEMQSAIDEDIVFVNQAIGQVREMSLNLRPPMLDVLGLEATLRWYAENQRQRTGLDVQMVGHLEGTRSDPELEISCFRIVQESITNVLRHARAKHVWIELRQEEAEFNVVIRDDGIGFDVADMQTRAGQGGSFGILAMRERVDLLGGRMEIESAPDRGTRVCAQFPRAHAARVSEASP